MIIANIMALTALVLAVYANIKLARDIRDRNSECNVDYQRIHDRITRNYIEHEEKIGKLTSGLAKCEASKTKVSKPYDLAKKSKTRRGPRKKPQAKK